jgi:hypothetical protein
MKKLFVIPIMFIYLVAVSGVMINLHYCGPQLESWNMYAEGEGCDGGECGDESKQSDDCCKDEVITAKVSNDQNTVSELKLKLSTEAWQPALLPVYPEYATSSVLSVKATAHKANAPPGRWQNIPLYKLHSGFIYYG